ncbi:hypothetical protein FQN50_009726 [Emmonsiellopsis sp. PD_5]|nr:hypothetical protein FQN50_009726 [Emmonsiellopsis sp. PD_5]
MADERVSHDRFEEFKQEDTSDWTDKEWKSFFSYIMTLTDQYIDDWDDELYRTTTTNKDSREYLRMIERRSTNVDDMKEEVQMCYDELDTNNFLKELASVPIAPGRPEISMALLLQDRRQMLYHMKDTIDSQDITLKELKHKFKLGEESAPEDGGSRRRRGSRR